MATPGPLSSLLALVALFGAIPAMAAPIKLCVSSYRSEGLDAVSSLGFRDKLVLELQAHGATVSPLPPGREGGSFDDPTCAEHAREELGAQGVLKVRLFRLGPTVRIKLHAYDLNGEPAGKAISSAPSRGFPGSAKVSADVKALLDELGQRATPEAQPAPSAEDPGPGEVPPADAGGHNVDDPATDPDTSAATPSSGPGLGAVLSYGGLGIGGLLLVSGAVTGGLALAISRELASVCDGELCPNDRADDITTMNTLASITNGLLAAGAVVAAVSVISLFLIGGDEGAEGDRP